MSTPLGRFDSGGQPPEDGRMERLEQRMDVVERKLDDVVERLARVEERMAGVEDRLARVETRLEFTATKADITRLVMWMVGLFIGFSAAGVTVITFVLNYANLPRPAAPAPQVIQAPPAPAPNVIVVPLPVQK
ncbi:MAG: hypothetical protein ACXU8N_12670 [Telluria sp.]